MKKFQALEDSKILLKGVTKTIKNETKEQKGGFLIMLLGTLGASLLGNLLAGKGIVRAGSRNKKGTGILRAGTGKQWDFQCRLIKGWGIRNKSGCTCRCMHTLGCCIL